MAKQNKKKKEKKEKRPMAKFKRMNPAAPAQGEIVPVGLNSDEHEIIYQPAHGRFFIPEKLGFRVGDYVDFFNWTKNDGKVFFCIISLGCPKGGRKISPYEKFKEQKDSRDIGTALVSFSLPDFNEWHLKLPKPDIVKDEGVHNHGQVFICCSTIFAERSGEQWGTRVRLGIAFNVIPDRILNGKTNPAADKPSKGAGIEG